MGAGVEEDTPSQKKVAANYTWRNDEEVAGGAEDAKDAADDVASASAAADDADNVEHDDEADVPRSRGKMIIKLAHKSKTYETRFEFDTISFIWEGKGEKGSRRHLHMRPPHTHTQSDTLTKWTEGWNLTAVHFLLMPKEEEEARKKTRCWLEY